MSMILQGTTPSLEIVIDSNDFSVTDVQKLEILIWQDNSRPSVYGLEDVIVDPDSNSYIIEFGESFTLSLKPSAVLFWQMRCVMPDGNIVGTVKSRGIPVSELKSKELLGE